MMLMRQMHYQRTEAELNKSAKTFPVTGLIILQAS